MTRAEIRRSCSLLLLIASLAVGCGGSASAPLAKGQPASLAQAGERILVHGDPRIGTYVSSHWGFDTSSYWIEGPDGLIVIDTQFLPSAAEELIAWAEESTGKSIALAIVLHANPDKFNGTDVFKRHGIRVVTSEQVRQLIPAIHEKRTKAFYERYRPDYPPTLPMPDSFGDGDTELAAAGIRVKAHVLGQGCSGAHVVIEFDGHLFTGDLIANGAHSWLELGRPDAWLERIEELRALSPKFVHPGRGASGRASLLDREAHYLKTVLTLVRDARPSGPPSRDAMEQLEAKVQAAFPGYDYPIFLKIGLPAVWTHLAGQASAIGR